MHQRFVIPLKREDLETEDSDELVRLALSDIPDVASISAEEASKYADDAVYALTENDVFHVNEQECFDGLYMAVRSFGVLPTPLRFKLSDALCANMKVLSVELAKLLSAPIDRSSNTVLQHRNSVQMYVFFMHWICEQAEAEAEQQRRDAATEQGKKAVSKGKKAAKDSGSALNKWDWPRCQQRMLKASADALRVDITMLFNAPHERQRMVELAKDMAMKAMETEDAMKLEDTRYQCFEVLCISALQYDQAEQLSERLFKAVRQHDHMPALVGQASFHAEEHFQTTKLAVTLITEFIKTDPAAYDEEASANNSAMAIKHAAEVIVSITELQPKTVSQNIALLLPYLGCKTYQIRSAIVHAIIAVLLAVFGNQAAPDERVQAVRMNSKNHCLSVLLERVLDKSAHTRRDVLKGWGQLCRENCVPLPHLPEIMKRAQGRLGDSSVLVVKEALKLMQTLVECNPLGSDLAASKILATIREMEARLKAMPPDADEEESEEEDDSVGPQWETGAVPVPSIGDQKGTDEGTDASATDVDDATPGAQAGSTEGEDAPVVGSEPDSVIMPSQTQADGIPNLLIGDRTNLRTLIATLKSGLDFVRTLTAAILDMRKLLLMCPNADVVKETIALLTVCKRFNVEEAELGLRAMWPLVFHREEPVVEAVVDAMYSLYCRDEGERRPKAHAKALIELVNDATLGELSSLEQIISYLLAGGVNSGSRQYELRIDVVSFVFRYLHDSYNACVAAKQLGKEPEYNKACATMRCSMTLLSMVAAHAPVLLRDHTHRLMEVLAGSCSVLQDAWVVRYCCTTLKHLAPSSAKDHNAAFTAQLPKLHIALVRVLITPYLREENWYSAAEEAIAALYKLHPAPFTLMEPLIKHLASALGGPVSAESGIGASGSNTASAVKISRFMFLVSHTAIHQLVLIDLLTRRVRREKLHKDLKPKSEQEDADMADGKEGDDIANQIGMGSVAEDAKLDGLREKIDAELVSARCLVGSYGHLIQQVCNSSSLLLSHVGLRGSALLALAKLMAIDATFCETNTRLVFSALASNRIEPGVRCSLMVAVGDLAFRFPNTVEPWTSHMYAPLTDSNLGVRTTCLGVLSHLILNDMMKVKGHIARIALCMRDSEEEEISKKARAFFSTLAKKAHRGSSPIFNLLPDIMSNLTHEKDLATEDFHTILHFLLDFIKDPKQQDSLKERLLTRFESVVVETAKAGGPVTGNDGGDQAEAMDVDVDGDGVEQAAQANGDVPGEGSAKITATPARIRAEWRSLAACIKSLTYSDKSMRRAIDLLRCYKHALGDPEVYEMFKNMSVQARKHGDKKGDLRELLASYETEIDEAHLALKDEPVPESESDEEEDEEEAEAAEGQAREPADIDTGAQEAPTAEPTSPTTSGVGAMPANSGVGATPATSGVGAMPANTGVGATPATSGVGATPATSGVRAPPATSGVGAQPATPDQSGVEDASSPASHPPRGSLPHKAGAATVKAEATEGEACGVVQDAPLTSPGGSGARTRRSSGRVKVKVERTSRRSKEAAAGVDHVDQDRAAAGVDNVDQDHTEAPWLDDESQDSKMDTRQEKDVGARATVSGGGKTKSGMTPTRVKLEKMTLVDQQ